MLLGAAVPLESVGDPAPVEVLLAFGTVPPLSVVPRDVPALGVSCVVELVVVSAVVAGIVEADDAGAVRGGLCLMLRTRRLRRHGRLGLIQQRDPDGRRRGVLSGGRLRPDPPSVSGAAAL